MWRGIISWNLLALSLSLTVISGGLEHAAAASPTLSLVAYSPDGRNSGTDRLGAVMQIQPAVQGSGGIPALSWTLQGAGTLTPGSGSTAGSGMYQAPTAMPGNPVVIVTASLTADLSIQASYQFSLVNPVPSIYSAGKLLTATTNSVPISGAGFVPQTSILVNGVAVPTAFQSNTSLIAQIPVVATASGTLPVSAQNPSPGGGLSRVFSAAVASTTISLTAYGPNQLGGIIQVQPTVQGTGNPALTWTLQGAGTLTPGSGSTAGSGMYQAPTAMPSNPVVIVTASLTANPSIQASYQFSLVNPVPSIYSVGKLLTATTNSVPISGAGFVPQTSIVVNGVAVPTTFQSNTSVIAQIPVAATASGTLPVTAQNPSPGGGLSRVFPAAVASTTISLTAYGSNQLGGIIQVQPAVQGTGNPALIWTLQGAGTLTPGSGSTAGSGMYQAPTAMPSNPVVIVTASLTANPAIQASYQFSLVNPVPSIYSVGKLLTATTNTVPISGAGFVPQTSILVNGVAVSTTFQSNTSVIAQIPVAATASGTLPVTAQNPSPGGGLSRVFSAAVASTTISLAAYGPNQLGGIIQVQPTVQGTGNPALTWTLQGAGTLTPGSGSTAGSGMYQAPTAMPSNPVVIVMASLTANPAIQASYQFSLVNPVPSIYSVGKLLTATTNSVPISGAGFVAQTSIVVNGVAVPTTFQSNTSVIAQIPVAATASGTLPVTAQNPSPGGGLSRVFPAAVASTTLSLTAYGPNQLGGVIQVQPSVQGTGNPALTWSLQGAGVLTPGTGSSAGSEMYQAPTAMPSNPVVIVTASLTANPAIQASYQFSLVNPVPVIYSVGKLLTAITNTVPISGAGFVAQTSIVVNGVAVPTTFQSNTNVIAQIPITATGSGTLPVTAQNPAPGGGVSRIFPAVISGMTLSVKTSGVNTTTVRLRDSIQLYTILSGSGDATLSLPVTWTVQGGGSISNSGLFQAPTDMPSSSVSMVTAQLTNNSSVASSYPVNLLNPIPVVNGSVPTHLLAGATNQVTLQGRGFVAGTTVLFNGSSVNATYVSPTSVSVAIDVPAGSTSVSLQAMNSNPGGSTSSAFTIPTGASSPVGVAIDTTPGLAIPTDFLGFSHEWGGAQWLMGSSLTQPNFVYRQLIRNLMNGETYPFFIRIGGNSTDLSGEPISGGETAFAELARDMQARFSLGVNLGSDNVQLATDQTRAYLGAMPDNSVATIEIGNEPDVYVANGVRPPSYGISNYLAEFATWRQQILPLLPSSTRLMGPSWGWSGNLQQYFASFEQQEESNVSIVSQHCYGIYQEPGQVVTAANLLAPSASAGCPSAVATSVSLAHSQKQLFRIGEMNSVTGGGTAGVSDSFSSALWGIDTMFEFAKVGVDGINWHGNSNCTYCLFGFDIINSGPAGNAYELINVSPLYYGLLFFQQAVTNGSRLLPVTVQTAANFKAWATVDQSGTIRIVLLNKDTASSSDVTISLPGYGDGTLARLVAPGPSSSGSVSFGGQYFDGSLDGSLRGTPIQESVSSYYGTYTLSLQPVSAALLTLSHP